MNIKQILMLYKKTNFLIAQAFFSVMWLIFFFGNPQFSETPFYWHHIPEILYFGFMGLWLREIKLPFFFILCAYILNAFTMPLLLGVNSVLNWLIVSGYAVALSIALPIGYIFQKKRERR